MQFKEIKNTTKIQCLIPVYDSESKRTRQKLIYTIDTRNLPVDSLFIELNTNDENMDNYRQEIFEYVQKFKKENAKSLLKNSLSDLRSLAINIADLLEKIDDLDAEDKNKIEQTIKLLNIGNR